MILPAELHGIRALRQLGEEHVNHIARLARLEEAEEGSVLFRQGEHSQQVYFVLSGTVSLEVEEPVAGAVDVSTVGPGELLGWSPVLGRPEMTATARAATRCRFAALDVQRILSLAEREPTFGMAFFRLVGLVLAERLDMARRCLALARAVGQRSLLESAPSPAR
jgi:CRP-like cAMP-binding protein